MKNLKKIDIYRVEYWSDPNDQHGQSSIDVAARTIGELHAAVAHLNPSSVQKLYPVYVTEAALAQGGE